MGVTGKIEIEMGMKHSADVFHELIVSKPHDVSNISPDKVHGCDVHEGEFGKPGSIIQWDYTLEGKKCVAKQIIEEIDEEKKIVRFKLIEGSSDLLNNYKSMAVIVHVITGPEIDAVKWGIEFEKFNDIGPYPTNLMDLFIGITRDIEAHHVEP